MLEEILMKCKGYCYKLICLISLQHQAEKVSNYYQIEETYSTTEDDIVLMVHVPSIKTTSLLKI
jgi:hypothetical protein